MDLSSKQRLFIVGAPKCGTTAMSEYLREHPEICVASPKEPDFWADDIATKHRISNFSAYEQCFEAATPAHRSLLDASVHYMQSRTAVPRIMTFAPSARVLAFLRNPAELAYSWYAEARYNCGETERDFGRAWRLCAERQAGRGVPLACPDPQLLDYRDVAALGTQVERLLSVVPAAQFKLVFHEDFERDPAAVYRDVLAFAGLADDGRTRFQRVNEAKQVRSAALMEVSHLVAKVKRRMGVSLSFGLIERVNVQRGAKAKLDPALRSELIGFFRGEVDKLEAITGRDLSHWRR